MSDSVLDSGGWFKCDHYPHALERRCIWTAKFLIVLSRRRLRVEMQSEAPGVVSTANQIRSTRRVAVRRSGNAAIRCHREKAVGTSLLTSVSVRFYPNA